MSRLYAVHSTTKLKLLGKINIHFRHTIQIGKKRSSRLSMFDFFVFVDTFWNQIFFHDNLYDVWMTHASHTHHLLYRFEMSIPLFLLHTTTAFANQSIFVKVMWKIILFFSAISNDRLVFSPSFVSLGFNTNAAVLQTLWRMSKEENASFVVFSPHVVIAE